MFLCKCPFCKRLHPRAMCRPFVFITPVFAGGLLLAARWHPPFPWLFGSAALLLLLALLVARLRILLLGPLLILAGWTDVLVHTVPLSPLDLRCQLGESPAIVTVRGRLLESPRLKLHTRKGRVTQRCLASVRVEALAREGVWVPVEGDVLASIPASPNSDFFDEQPVEITGVIAPPPGPAAEGLFDYRRYLETRGIYYQLSTTGWEDWHRQEPHWSQPPLPDRFLAWAKSTLAIGLPEEDETLRLLWAMSLDWRTGLGDDIGEPFLQAGTMHMFAIDGLRIALLSGAIVTLLRALRVSRAWCGLVALPVIWFYTAATGWESSAVRASIMMTVILGGWALNRPSDLLNSLCAAGFIILAWDPLQLWQAGFQLSFLVVMVIAVMLTPLNNGVNRWLHHDPLLPEPLLPRWQKCGLGFLRAISRTVVMSFTAWIGSLPLSLKYFHLFNPVSTLANLLAVPLGTLALIANLAALICNRWLSPATTLFNHAAWACMKAMTWVSVASASLPGAYRYVAEPSWLAIFLYYALILGLFGGWLRTPWQRLTAAGIWGVLALGCLIRQTTHWQDTSLTVLPGKHSVWVDAPNPADRWLIDAGDSDYAEFTVKPFLHARGVNRVPRLVLTEGSVTVAEGASDLDQRFHFGEVWTSSVRFRSSPYHRIVDYFQQSPSRIHTFSPDQTAGCWQILHPLPHSGPGVLGTDSLVLLGRFSRFQILLLPDLNRDGQEQLLARTNRLHADLVVAGLPSRDEPLCDSLLRAIHPQVIVITDAETPAYHQASAALQARLAQTGVPVFYSREAAAITVTIHSGNWRLQTMDGQTFTPPQSPAPGRLSPPHTAPPE